MEKNIATYHLIKKLIYIIKDIVNWCIHLTINKLNNHIHINISPLLNDDLLKNNWIKDLAIVAKLQTNKLKKSPPNF